MRIGREIREAVEVERPQDARMRYDEVRLFYDFLAEEQHVYVYCARGLLPGCSPHALQGGLDTLAIAQEFDGRRTVTNLDHAVQVIWLLLFHLDRCRLVHLGEPAHLQQRSLSERSERRPQVPQTVPKVAPQAQESLGHWPKATFIEIPKCTFLSFRSKMKLVVVSARLDGYVSRRRVPIISRLLSASRFCTGTHPLRYRLADGIAAVVHRGQFALADQLVRSLWKVASLQNWESPS